MSVTAVASTAHLSSSLSTSVRCEGHRHATTAPPTTIVLAQKGQPSSTPAVSAFHLAMKVSRPFVAAAPGLATGRHWEAKMTCASGPKTEDMSSPAERTVASPVRESHAGISSSRVGSNGRTTTSGEANAPVSSPWRASCRSRSNRSSAFARCRTCPSRSDGAMPTANEAVAERVAETASRLRRGGVRAKAPPPAARAPPRTPAETAGRGSRSLGLRGGPGPVACAGAPARLPVAAPRRRRRQHPPCTSGTVAQEPSASPSVAGAVGAPHSRRSSCPASPLCRAAQARPRIPRAVLRRSAGE
mmetsp:Transcript_4955/g.15659  ORF Transcript_4955/g.15659 Transcript_4955/m.15659 type:complete len:302 (+) Transcript_4955:1148-2053(+)